MAASGEMRKRGSVLSAPADNLLSFLLFVCTLSSVSAQLSDERTALLELKKSFSDPHGNLDSWNGDSSNHCSWVGVSCDPDFRISGLTIRGNLSLSRSCLLESESALHGFGIVRNCSDQSEISGALGGRLSPFIGKFSKLRVLTLSFNKIGGEIPVDVWGLKNLVVLDLEGNDFLDNFSGFRFCGLRKLRVLNLAHNKFFGMFPPSLSESRSLRILNLAGNEIHGFVPGFLGYLRKLRVLNLSFNQLVGYIPSTFGYDCGNLEHLDLSSNFLTGEIPRDLGKCGRLRKILLSSNALRGMIPSELGKLQNLEVLNVARNKLRGPFPANLGNCTRLSVLVLSSNFNALHVNMSPRGRVTRVPSGDYNSFKGFSIPEEITTLPKLKVLWAPNANFEGRFPRNWGDCRSLMMVNLAHNQFTGEIVGLFAECNALQYLDLSYNRLTRRLDEKSKPSCVKMLNFSGNRLSGPTPSSDTDAYLTPHGSSSASASFLVKLTREVQIKGADDLRHDDVLMPLPPSTAKLSPKSSDNTLKVASVASALSLLLVATVVLVLFCFRNKGEEMTRIEITDLPQIEKVVLFNSMGLALTFESIVNSTDNFHRRNCIGTGGFGKTYRAEIAPGRNVAVKRLTAERHQGAAQFQAEVTTLGQVKHPNLITLLGYYACGQEMLLIYNYLPGGNLDRFIKDRSKRIFNYAVLHKIAIHVASALWYLHDQCSPPILHRDIKPSNILLDGDYNAFLADFGLSKILSPTDSDKTRVAGTYGYIAPEYALTGRVSDKVDVYSYGVVLLELLSEKRVLDPSFYSHQDGFNIVSWARMQFDHGEAHEVFADRLWEMGPHDKLMKILHVAMLCTVETVIARPPMRQVVQRLKQIQPCSDSDE